MNKRRSIQTDNHGMTLVELLVSLAVISIVLAMLTAIMINVLNMSVRTNANVTLQNESQTTMNLIEDTLMGAKGIIYNPEDTGDDLLFIYAGSFEWNGKVGSGNKAVFDGDVIIYRQAPTDPAAYSGEERYGKLYLMSYKDSSKIEISTDEAGCEDTDSHDQNLKKLAHTLSDKARDSFPSDEADRKPYLLGKYVNNFSLNIVGYNEWTTLKLSDVIDASNPTDAMGNIKYTDQYYYEGPLIFDITLNVTMEYKADKFLTREMKDSVNVRNRLPYVLLKAFDNDDYEVFYLK